ncbi:MAG: histidine phosphatase family protein [Patescibacteria group bacterium]
MIDPKTEVHLYLIRHGESHMNLNPHLIGGQSLETPLSQAGEDQCTALYKYFFSRKVDFDYAYSSHLVRVKITARFVLGPNAPVIVIDKRLAEYSAGEWEGRPRHAVHTPEVLYQMAEMGIDFQPPGGESQRQVITRVSEFLNEAVLNNQNVLEAGKRINIAFFSSGLTIKSLLQHILEFDSRFIWRMKIDNCSVSELIYNSRGWWPQYINRVPY